MAQEISVGLFVAVGLTSVDTSFIFPLIGHIHHTAILSDMNINPKR